MPGNYNAEFEAQIALYRRARRILGCHDINFRTSRAATEAIIRAKLTQPDSVTFFWPSSRDPRYRNNRSRHQGYVMLGFESRSDCRLAEADLQNLVVNGRPVRISRPSRPAFLPRSERTQEAATDHVIAASATAAPAPEPAVTTTTTTTTTATTPTPATNPDPSDSVENSRTNWW
ncbi:hypothetical protein V8C35DRAFT_331453 [Trichoderma chlorosporum]